MRNILIILAVLMSVPARADADLPSELAINDVEFIKIPAGQVWHQVPVIDPVTSFAKGSGRREVRLWTDAYYIAKFEARGRDFQRFMASGSSRFTAQYEPDGKRPSDGATQGCAVRRSDEKGYYLTEPDKDLPATHLSWDLADEFARWMGFRLPTEAEWVRAFRGDDKRMYPWGNEFPDDTYAAFQEGATQCHVQPVNAHPKGKSPFGVHNMAGNVFEYVADWYNVKFYNGLKDGDRNPVATEPLVITGLRGPKRVVRGGRWASSASEISMAGNRDSQATDEPFICYGARFAIDVTTVRRHLAAGTATILKP
jgi:formylglycine-generating enzyme required for sulfatase activity